VHGVLVVDKPRGVTSHDVVMQVRRSRGTREVGHAGTLDPMATGVLVVLVGEGTKLAPYLTASDKEYEATLSLGMETDSLDADGREVKRVAVPEDWRDHLAAALLGERSRTSQVPPAISAVHVEGERAYARARRGETVTLEPRDVEVRSIELIGELRLRLVVSKGYYVRSLARDLALRLGTVGHLAELRRTRSGPFTLAHAGPLIPVAAAAALALPVVTLTALGREHAKVGKPVALTELSSAPRGAQAWLDEAGELVAIGEIDEGVGRVRRGFGR
jgi:tRNA pseudouridine55 synthase